MLQMHAATLMLPGGESEFSGHFTQEYESELWY
jgi:hypothetical protein